MNASQEILWELCYGKRGLVNAQAIGYRLHKAYDYCSDVCRRERVDFLAIFNEILRLADGLAHSDPARMLAIAGPIHHLLYRDTGWIAIHVATIDRRGDDNFERLCEQTGILLEDLGGAIKALARIEQDGSYDDSDDPQIQEFTHKSGCLIGRLQSLCAALHEHRESGTRKP